MNEPDFLNFCSLIPHFFKDLSFLMSMVSKLRLVQSKPKSSREQKCLERCTVLMWITHSWTAEQRQDKVWGGNSCDLGDYTFSMVREVCVTACHSPLGSDSLHSMMSPVGLIQRAQAGREMSFYNFRQAVLPSLGILGLRQDWFYQTNSHCIPCFKRHFHN